MRTKHYDSVPQIGTAVTVVVPTYNGRAYLPEAIQSVWAQTRLPDELIVVDDASSDRTADVAEELLQASPVPARVIRLPRNSGGPARPINVGVRASRGGLIAVLDQDDQFLPEKLAHQAKVLETEPTVAVVASFCGKYGNAHDTVHSSGLGTLLAARAHSERNGSLVISGERALCDLIQLGNFLCGYPGFMFRRSACENIGGVDESLRIASDHEFLCWLCRTGDLAVLPRVHYLRRMHDQNLTRMRSARIAVEEEYYILEKALTAEPSLWEQIDQLGMHRQLGELAFCAGYLNLDVGNNSRARAFFSASSSHGYDHWKARKFWTLSWLPPVLLRQLRRLKARQA